MDTNNYINSLVSIINDRLAKSTGHAFYIRCRRCSRDDRASMYSCTREGYFISFELLERHAEHQIDNIPAYDQLITEFEMPICPDHNIEVGWDDQVEDVWKVLTKIGKGMFVDQQSKCSKEECTNGKKHNGGCAGQQ